MEMWGPTMNDPITLGFALVFICFAWGLIVLAAVIAFVAPINICTRLVFLPFVFGLLLFCLAMGRATLGVYLYGGSL